ncbi:hypothetical protein B0I35DRAFT_350782 [Stachybotrys elegans]|uniref:Macro domain-like protein n=1 Tax=Stachybotrys elegans TaxID=80388 RepID=A0A8K0SWU1_9HYPO|nr:hypothetical protein B0I35DRAFT_350782 [Stachybotrys elegans]
MPVPHLHLLLMEEQFAHAFEQAAEGLRLHPSVTWTKHDSALSMLPDHVQFDAIVSPANSYGLMDGGFDDALSRAFSPIGEYDALTRIAQQTLYKEWRGYAPPGTCTIVRIPDSFSAGNKNVWGTKHLLLCPTMRMPQNVTWDREVVYECIWSLLCAVDKHNSAEGAERIESVLMPPLATGVGRVTPKRWASQVVLAINHFIDATNEDTKWESLSWNEVALKTAKIQGTWYW